MLYARINKETDEVLEFPVTEKQLRNALVNTTLPTVITEISLLGTDYVVVPPLTRDQINLQATASAGVVPTTPIKDPETGKWIRKYELKAIELEDQLDRLSLRWSYIRARRDAVLKEIDWRILRNQREARLGLTQTDDIAVLDAKAQEMADVTETNEDPFLIDLATLKI